MSGASPASPSAPRPAAADAAAAATPEAAEASAPATASAGAAAPAAPQSVVVAAAAAAGDSHTPQSPPQAPLPPPDPFAEFWIPPNDAGSQALKLAAVVERSARCREQHGEGCRVTLAAFARGEGKADGREGGGGGGEGESKHGDAWMAVMASPRRVALAREVAALLASKHLRGAAPSAETLAPSAETLALRVCALLRVVSELELLGARLEWLRALEGAFQRAMNVDPGFGTTLETDVDQSVLLAWCFWERHAAEFMRVIVRGAPVLVASADTEKHAAALAAAVASCSRQVERVTVALERELSKRKDGVLLRSERERQNSLARAVQSTRLRARSNSVDEEEKKQKGRDVLNYEQLSANELQLVKSFCRLVLPLPLLKNEEVDSRHDHSSLELRLAQLAPHGMVPEDETALFWFRFFGPTTPRVPAIYLSDALYWHLRRHFGKDNLSVELLQCIVDEVIDVNSDGSISSFELALFARRFLGLRRCSDARFLLVPNFERIEQLRKQEAGGAVEKFEASEAFKMLADDLRRAVSKQPVQNQSQQRSSSVPLHDDHHDAPSTIPDGSKTADDSRMGRRSSNEGENDMEGKEKQLDRNQLPQKSPDEKESESSQIPLARRLRWYSHLDRNGAVKILNAWKENAKVGAKDKKLSRATWPRFVFRDGKENDWNHAFTITFLNGIEWFHTKLDIFEKGGKAAYAFNAGEADMIEADSIYTALKKAFSELDYHEEQALLEELQRAWRHVQDVIESRPTGGSSDGLNRLKLCLESVVSHSRSMDDEFLRDWRTNSIRDWMKVLEDHASASKKLWKELDNPSNAAEKRAFERFSTEIAQFLTEIEPTAQDGRVLSSSVWERVIRNKEPDHADEIHRLFEVFKEWKKKSQDELLMLLDLTCRSEMASVVKNPLIGIKARVFALSVSSLLDACSAVSDCISNASRGRPAWLLQSRVEMIKILQPPPKLGSRRWKSKQNDIARAKWAKELEKSVAELEINSTVWSELRSVLCRCVELRGVSAMEIILRELKAKGRELVDLLSCSAHGVSEQSEQIQSPQSLEDEKKGVPSPGSTSDRVTRSPSGKLDLNLSASSGSFVHWVARLSSSLEEMGLQTVEEGEEGPHLPSAAAAKHMGWLINEYVTYSFVQFLSDGGVLGGIRDALLAPDLTLRVPVPGDHDLQLDPFLYSAYCQNHYLLFQLAKLPDVKELWLRTDNLGRNFVHYLLGVHQTMADASTSPSIIFSGLLSEVFLVALGKLGKADQSVGQKPRAMPQQRSVTASSASVPHDSPATSNADQPSVVEMAPMVKEQAAHGASLNQSQPVEESDHSPFDPKNRKVTLLQLERPGSYDHLLNDFDVQGVPPVYSLLSACLHHRAAITRRGVDAKYAWVGEPTTPAQLLAQLIAMGMRLDSADQLDASKRTFFSHALKKAVTEIYGKEGKKEEKERKNEEKEGEVQRDMLQRWRLLRTAAMRRDLALVAALLSPTLPCPIVQNPSFPQESLLLQIIAGTNHKDKDSWHSIETERRLVRLLLEYKPKDELLDAAERELKDLLGDDSEVRLLLEPCYKQVTFEAKSNSAEIPRSVAKYDIGEQFFLSPLEMLVLRGRDYHPAFIDILNVLLASSEFAPPEKEAKPKQDIEDPVDRKAGEVKPRSKQDEEDEMNREAGEIGIDEVKSASKEPSARPANTRPRLNALHIAAFFNRQSAIHILLDTYRWPSENRTRSGLSALHLAARAGAVEAVEMLSEPKWCSDVDCTSDRKLDPTPIMMAMNKLLSVGAKGVDEQKDSDDLVFENVNELRRSLMRSEDAELEIQSAAAKKLASQTGLSDMDEGEHEAERKRYADVIDRLQKRKANSSKLIELVGLRMNEEGMESVLWGGVNGELVSDRKRLYNARQKKPFCARHSFLFSADDLPAATKNERNQVIIEAKFERRDQRVLRFVSLLFAVLAVIATSIAAVESTSRNVPSAFYVRQSLSQALASESFFRPPSTPGGAISSPRTFTFLDFNNLDEFWLWLEGPVLEFFYPGEPSVFWDSDSSSKVLRPRSLVGGHNLVLGVPRLRQVRSEKQGCDTLHNFASDAEPCFSSGEAAADSTAPFGAFGPDRLPATFQSATALGSWRRVQGRVSDYPGGGFVFNLPDLRNATARAQALEAMADLRNNSWVDAKTRAVFLEFAIYNANENWFAVAQFIVELPRVGGIVTSTDIRINRLRYLMAERDRAATAFEALSLGLWGVYLILIYWLRCADLYGCYFLCWKRGVQDGVDERKAAKMRTDAKVRMAMSPLMPWLLDLSLALLLLLWATLRIVAASYAEDIDWYQHADFANIGVVSQLLSVANHVTSLILVVLWGRLVPHLTAIPPMRKLLVMVSLMMGEFLKVAALLIFAITVFLVAEHVSYGFATRETATMFSAFIELVMGLVRGRDFSLMAADYNSRPLATTYNIMFLVVVNLLLLNLLIAILNDAYKKATEEAGRAFWANWQFNIIEETEVGPVSQIKKAFPPAGKFFSMVYRGFTCCFDADDERSAPAQAHIAASPTL